MKSVDRLYHSLMFFLLDFCSVGYTFSKLGSNKVKRRGLICEGEKGPHQVQKNERKNW